MMNRSKVFLGLTALFLFLGSQAETQTPNGEAEQPRSALQIYRLGRDLESRNRMAEAESNYNEAIRICQDEVSRNAAARETYAVITWALRRMNRHADVITWGERGLRLYPDEYRVLETVGESWFYLGDYNRSLLNMQRFVNAVPNGERSPVAYFFIGEIYRLTEKYRHADIAYTTALQLDPNNALWWYRLATVLEKVGDRNPAVAAYQRAVRITPDYREAIQGLARLQSQ